MLPSQGENLFVITGLSGSGKSSLAYDTIFARSEDIGAFIMLTIS